MRVLGIDPGYAIVGWGVVEYVGNRFAPVGYGAVVSVFKASADIVRQNFGGNGAVQRRSVADDRIDMRNPANGFLQIGLIDFA